MPSSALRQPFVLPFALGRTVGVAGSQIVSVAVGWELWQRTGSAWALGLVGLVEVAPVFALVGLAGAIVDRHPRRTVALGAQLGLALASAGLALASALAAPVPLIYALLAIVGAARSFSAPATSALIPQIVAVEYLSEANAWNASSFQLASVVGPAVGGGLIATFGLPATYAAAAAMQLAFTAILVRLPAIAPPSSVAGASRRGFLVGFEYVRRHPVLLAAITLDLFAVLLGGVEALLPIFATDLLHVGATGLGWLRAAPSVGAFATSVVITRLRPWRRPGITLLVVVAGYSLATVAFGVSRDFTLSIATLGAVGAFDAVSIVLRSTLTQVLTPDAVRGRVAAIVYVFIGSSNELGAFESGVAAALLGPVVAVVLGGVGSLAAVALVAWRWPELARLGPLSTLAPPDSGA